MNKLLLGRYLMIQALIAERLVIEIQNLVLNVFMLQCIHKSNALFRVQILHLGCQINRLVVLFIVFLLHPRLKGLIDTPLSFDFVVSPKTETLAGTG